MPENSNPDFEKTDDNDAADGLSEVPGQVQAPVIDPLAWDGNLNPNDLRDSVIAVIGAVSMMPDHRHWPAAVKLMLELYPEIKSDEQKLNDLLGPFKL